MMRIVSPLVLLLSVCILLNPNAFAGRETTDITELIQKAVDASKVTPYEGVIAYRRYAPHTEWIAEMKVYRPSEKDKRLEIIEIKTRCRSEPGKPFETISLKTIKGLVLIHTHESLWGTPLSKEERKKLMKEMGSFSIFRPFWDGDRVNVGPLDLLESNYKLCVEKADPIAGRKTVMIRIDPKNDRRPSMKVWIDVETKAQLKYDRFTHENELMESCEFKEILFDPSYQPYKLNPEGYFKIHSTKPSEGDDPSLDFTPFVPSWLPKGFQKVEEDRIGRERNEIRTKYSDGFASFSLFQRTQTEEEKKKQEEREKSDDEKSRRKIRKYTHFGRDFLVRETRGLRLSAIGDISSRSIGRTIMRMRPVQDSDSSNNHSSDK